jgi:hypothetical protein
MGYVYAQQFETGGHGKDEATMTTGRILEENSHLASRGAIPESLRLSLKPLMKPEKSKAREAAAISHTSRLARTVKDPVL